MTITDTLDRFTALPLYIGYNRLKCGSQFGDPQPVFRQYNEPEFTVAGIGVTPSDYTHGERLGKTKKLILMKSKIIYIAKGITSVFVLKLFVIAVVLSVQACQKSSISNSETQKAALANFRQSLKVSAPAVRTLFHKYVKDVSIRSGSIQVNGSQRLNRLAEGDQPPTDGGDGSGGVGTVEPLPYVEIPPADAAAVQPLVESSKALLDSYGLTDAMIQEFDGDPNDPRLIDAALVVYSVEEQRSIDAGAIAFSSFLLGAQTSFARKALTDCLLEAVGIADLGVLLRMGIKQAIIDLGLTGVARMVGGFLVKHVGWWGAIASVYVFTDCMTS